MKKLTNILTEQELIRISSLDEVLLGPSMFLIDTNYGINSDTEKQIATYPLTKDKNLAHDLLNLYGTHWSYLINNNNWKEIERRDGDSAIILNNIKIGKKNKNLSKYAFTQKYINRFKSLWIFNPETPSWQYHQEILIPMFNLDVQKYKFQKKMARKK